ncbi:MAG: RraA family protein [Clostridiales bacterium]|nr:RraA family protein [Clostridiales bacterium]MCD8369112.1 RraA family protein [Clostridiales bacterium]
MMAAGCRIRRNFKRPDRELVEMFRDIPVANLDDNMGRIAAVDSCIYPLNPNARLLGTAFTVNAPAGDNLLFHKALDMAQPGDVIVLANKGSMSRSLCGEIMSSYARSRGIAGIIIDGCVRDSYTLSHMDFPVYAKGVTPNGPYKNGPGEMNFPVSFAGIVINPGDIIVGDYDGLLVIRPDEHTAELAEKAKKYHAGEEKQLEGILTRGEWPRPWVDELLEKVGFEFVD